MGSLAGPGAFIAFMTYGAEFPHPDTDSACGICTGMRGRRAVAWLTSGQRLVRNLGPRPGAEARSTITGAEPR